MRLRHSPCPAHGTSSKKWSGEPKSTFLGLYIIKKRCDHKSIHYFITLHLLIFEGVCHYTFILNVARSY